MMASPLWKIAMELYRAHPAPGQLPPMLFLTDRARVPDPLPVVKALPRGAGVIIRDYDAPDRAALAKDMAACGHDRGLLVLVAGNPELAASVRADGVHLPEQMMHLARAIRRDEPAWVVTVAAHGRPGLTAAEQAGADAALLSPVFPTESHPGGKTLGPIRFAALVRGAGLPVYALGGINGRTARRLRGSGAVGIAAIGGLSG